MRAGRAIRQEAALAAAGAKPCPLCGHRTDAHHELPYSSLSIDDRNGVVETVNPAHVAGEFHCDHEGCACILVPFR